MNAVAANDIEAADLLALAWLDDGGSPGRCGSHGHTGRLIPDMTATAREPKDRGPTPETSGGHSAVARSSGHPPVTARRAEMIAAASGRARQQLTPA